MYKLISADGVDFIDPEGSFVLSKTDVVNEYEGEDGCKTVEVVRSGKISASVSYNGIEVRRLREMAQALHTVTTFRIYDALTDTCRTVKARVSSLKVQKVHHRHGLSLWSLSFDLDEL